MKTIITISIICLTVHCSAPGCRSAETQLYHSGGSLNDGFGRAISLSGESILIGAPLDDDHGSDAGAVYFFQRSSSMWVQLQKIVNSEVSAGDEFGTSMSIQNDQAIIGAPADNTHGFRSGAAYFYRFDGSTWMEDSVVTDPDGSSFDQFGTSVTISGEFSFVGVPYDDDQGNQAGSVFVFWNDNGSWTFHQKLESGTAEDAFGCSVSMDGSFAAVGAYGTDLAGLNTGAVYVYHLDGTSWTIEQIITAGDPGLEDYFGLTVALDHPQLLISAPHDNDLGSDSGSAYVFTREAGVWTQKEKLNASDGTTEALFGESLALSGRFAIVGSHHRDGPVHADEGGVYLFHYDGRTWVELTKLLPQISSEYDYFGYSVAISEDYAAVGAPRNSDLVNLEGTAYVFDDFAAFFPVPAIGVTGATLTVLFFSLILFRRS